jgi:iron complex outermembrane receptor protein
MAMHSKSWTLLVSVAAACISVAAPALAQDKAAQPGVDQSGNDIIVTARRSEERLQDVPISISVLSQDALTKRNISNPTDLATYVPSLSSNANFGPEKASFAIRGFTQEGKTSPSVAVYFADVVAPRANGGTTSGNGAGPGSMFDLENVQVLKGPQGTLFGRNTTGGAILLVPTKPKDELGGYVEGSAGDYNMHRVQAVLNVPINDTFLVRGAFDWQERDGYLHNISGIGPKDLGNTDYIAARLSVVAHLTPTLENYMIASFSNSHNNGVVPNMTVCNTGNIPGVPGPTGAAVIFGPLACAQIARQQAAGGGAYTVSNDLPDPFERVRQWQVINTTTWQASDTLTVKNIVSYAEYREQSSFDLWGTALVSPPGSFFPPPGPVTAIDLYPGPSGYNVAQSTFTEEFQVHGRTSNDSLNYQVGAYFEISDPLANNSTQSPIFLNCTDVYTFQCTDPLGFGTIAEYSLKDYYNNTGFYAQVDYKPIDKLTLTGGFRYTIDKMRETGSTVSVAVPTPGQPLIWCQDITKFNVNGDPTQRLFVDNMLSPACLETVHQNSSRPTWLLNAQYNFTRDIMAYAKWARGYRQGGINSSDLGVESWGPEKVDTYEIGAKTSWRGKVPGFLNLAGFYNDFRDQQLAVNALIAPQYENVIPPQQLIVNAGKSRIWGFEADGSFKPFTGLQIDASYAYLNTKLESFTTPPLPIYFASLDPAAEIGGPLELSPKNRVTVTGTYTLPLDQSVGTVDFGVTFTHTDSQRASSPVVSPLLYTLPATDILNLNADWRSVLGSPVDISFFMTNVTNEDAVLFNTGAWQTLGTDGGHPELPRMWGFRLKYHFGH